ncbi:MAG: DUF1501 domain-containing protein [Planctomycetota bacterium]|jgi:uncharacterized protein (DUF1501 family)|nr:DUF1501 domain-containing protein [Planctomycetota bacterium]
MELSRREFSKRGLLTMSSAMVVPAFFQRTAQAVETASSDNMLVLIQLAGGNDGLNTVIPYTDPLYYQNRPTLGQPREDVLDLDGQLGLHPQLTGMKTLFDENIVKVVQALGYPNPSRSHFRSTDIWTTGNPKHPEGTGWLGRYFDGQDNSKHPFPSMALGGSGQKALKGTLTGAPTFQNINSFRLFPEKGMGMAREADVTVQREKDVGAFKALHRMDGGHFAQADFLKDASMKAFVSSENLQKMVGRYNTPVNYPNNGLANQLKLVGKLIASGINTRAFHVAIGGFDTHSNQARGHAARMNQIGGSLVAFMKDLRSMKKAEKVVIMTYSEFGRRVKENGSRGTDHGAAAPLFVIGEKVKGGILGEHPSLADLRSGDLKYKIDFRTVYTTMIEQWLGGKTDDIFRQKFEPASIFA